MALVDSGGFSSALGRPGPTYQGVTIGVDGKPLSDRGQCVLRNFLRGTIRMDIGERRNLVMALPRRFNRSYVNAAWKAADPNEVPLSIEPHAHFSGGRDARSATRNGHAEPRRVWPAHGHITSARRRHGVDRERPPGAVGLSRGRPCRVGYALERNLGRVGWRRAGDHGPPGGARPVPREVQRRRQKPCGVQERRGVPQRGKTGPHIIFLAFRGRAARAAGRLAGSGGAVTRCRRRILGLTKCGIASGISSDSSTRPWN